MATPKKRKSLTRRRRARAQDKIVLPNLSKCENCQNARLSHHMCPTCGYYNGQCIIPPKIKKE